MLPDMMTFAKRVTSGYVPLGGVLVSEWIARYFDNNVLGAGLTYSGHPLAYSDHPPGVRGRLRQPGGPRIRTARRSGTPARGGARRPAGPVASAIPWSATSEARASFGACRTREGLRGQGARGAVQPRRAEPDEGVSGRGARAPDVFHGALQCLPRRAAA